MKINNWSKRLATSLAACGLLSPAAAARAANLNQNLIVNGDFENVDVTVGSYYNAPKILDWNYVTLPGYTYSHDLSMGYGGNTVPGFANGTLPTGGHWYFAPGNSYIHEFESAISQDIDVSMDATGTLISAGAASYSLSGFFSSFSDQGDRAFVRAQFLNATDVVVGTAEISTPDGVDLMEWTQFTATGTLPAATKTIQIFSWGQVLGGAEGSADGYQDNLDFRISLAADFDLDGDVDGNDLLKWQRGLGINANAMKMDGDADGDHNVDGDDLAIWKGQFPAATAAVGQIPEPSGVVLVAAGMLMTLTAARRDKRRS